MKRKNQNKFLSVALLVAFLFLSPMFSHARPAFGTDCGRVVTSNFGCTFVTEVCDTYFLWIRVSHEVDIVEVYC